MAANTAAAKQRGSSSSSSSSSSLRCGTSLSVQAVAAGPP
jgi:hypothetical protein